MLDDEETQVRLDWWDTFSELEEAVCIIDERSAWRIDYRKRERSWVVVNTCSIQAS